MAFAACGLTGCNTLEGYPQPYQDTDKVITADAPYLLPDVRDNANAADASKRGGMTPQQYRDTVVYRRLQVIDIYYYQLEADLTASYDGLSVGADLTVLALNGLAATTGTAATKAALAAASAGVLGAKTTVNTDVFYQKTLPALLAQMRAQRLKDYADIKTSLTKPYAQYTIDQALDDVNAYYIAGTLPGAVMQLTADAGATASTASKTIDALRTVDFGLGPSSNSARVIKWLYTDGDMTKAPIAANQAAFDKWKAGPDVDARLTNLPDLQIFYSHDPTIDSALAGAIVALKIP
jgi:hypothetical protein